MPYYKRVFFLLFLVTEFFSMNAQTPLREFKLALVQMYVEPGELQKNLNHAADLIAQAAKGGADIALLPEVLDLGWTHPSAKKLAGTIPGGKSFEALSEAAVKNKIWLCCGIVERDGDVVYNSAVIIDSEGKLVIKHRKLNELEAQITRRCAELFSDFILCETL